MIALKHSIAACSLWLVLSGRLASQTQDFAITPSSLAEWQIIGADRPEVLSQQKLSLPAGCELVRTFAARNGAVMLWSASSPIFPSTPADWPVVQVGPASVALTRQGDHGEVVLLVGDTVRSLPVLVTLDGIGRTLRPLELALGFDPATGTGLVAVADKVLTFKDAPSASQIEVSLAAGGLDPWPQDSLIITTFDAPTAATFGKASDQGFGSNVESALIQLATDRLQRTGVRSDASSGAIVSSPSLPGKAEPVAAPPSLEIFTPPSVRQGPAAVRDAIARSRSN